MTIRALLIAVAAILLVVSAPAAFADIDVAGLNWGVQYLIDTSQTDFGQSQSPSPRDNRGLAISPDGRYLYAGYNNSYSTGEVRKIDLYTSDYIDASVAQVTGVRGKSIAVDDAGRVYLAEGSSIKVYDGDLAVNQFNITGLTSCEGVTVCREGLTLALYTTDRTNKTLTRWELTESGGIITGATKAGLDGDGIVTITSASSLRGLEVDSSGQAWIADQSANKVFRVSADGLTVDSVSITKPMDIAIDGGQIFVTQYTSRTVSVLNTSMVTLSTIAVPWTTLELDPDGQSAGGALSGIVTVSGKGFYVTNETGQTANEKSTYGRVDGNSGWLGDKYYTDLLSDDNDPILKAFVPEPASVLALVCGLAGMIGLRRRPRK